MRTKSTKISVLILSLVALLCLSMFTFTTVNFARASSRVEVKNGKVEIYQLQPDESSLNHSYVIKDTDGSLVVIDGGAAGAQENKAPYMTAALRAISGVGEGEHFTVKAWFLSHAHNDHIAELAKMLYGYVDGETVTISNESNVNVTYAADKNFTIEKFYFDFPEGSERTANDYSTFWLDTVLKTGLDNYASVNGAEYTYDAVNGVDINADTIKAGQNIQIGNLRFEILQTWYVNERQVNDNSLIIRLWFDGQSVLFLNDTAIDAGNRLLNTYGANYLKSDIVQLAHHGQNGVTKEVYQAIDANVRLWANFKSLWLDNTAENDSSNQTSTVRTWFGLPEDPNQYTPSDKDLVAGLYDYPAGFDSTSVSSWTSDVLSKMKISLPYTPAYDNEFDFQMIDGASIRLNEGSTGIRFAARMSGYDPEAEYGFVIVPDYYFTEAIKTNKNYVPDLIDAYGEDGILKMKSNPVNGTLVNKGPHYEIYGSIDTIRYQNMNLTFTGLAYEYKNDVYSYPKFEDVSDFSRSIYDVAVKAANDDMIKDTFENDEMDIINGFVHKALSQKNGVPENEYNPETQLTYNFGITEEVLNMEYLDKKGVSVTGDFKDEDVVYEIADENVVKYDKETKTFKAVGIGETTVTAKVAYATDTFIVKSVVDNDEKDALLSFDDASYVEVASAAKNPNIGTIKTEWLDEFDGETGVLKVTMLHDINTYGGSDAAVVLDLPKAHSGSYTIRYQFGKVYDDDGCAYPGVSNARWRSIDEKGWATNTNGDERSVKEHDLIGKWTNQCVTIGQSNKISLLTLGNGVYTDINGVDHASTPSRIEVYFSVVLDGDHVAELDEIDDKKADAIKETLNTPTGYMAKFDNENYLDLIYFAGSGNYKAEIVTVDDVKALKVTTEDKAKGAGGKIVINLPTPLTDNYTVKIFTKAVGNKSLPNVLRLNNITDTIKVDAEVNAAKYVNGWSEINATFHADHTDRDTFNFQWFNTESGCAMELYVAFIYNKDAALAGAKAELVSDLDTNYPGYIAKFNNEKYLDFITYEGSGSANYEIANDIDNGKVLKITITANVNKGEVGQLTITLPKQLSSSYVIKAKFALVEGTLPSHFRFNTVNGDTASDSGDKTPANLVGDWVEYKFNRNTKHTSAAYDFYHLQWLAAAAAANFELEIYVEEIVNLDDIKTGLANKLPNGYKANFNNVDYLRFIEYTGNGTMEKSISTIGGETNVLKLSLSEAKSSWAKVEIELPKALPSEYTIKIYFENVDGGSLPNYFRLNSGGSTQTSDKELTSTTAPSKMAGTWQDIDVTLNSYWNGSTSKYVLQYINTVDVLKGNVYIAYIYNKSEVAQSLASSLTSPYVADFSSNEYLKLIGKESSASGVLNAEILPLFAGETNVLKLTIAENDSGLGIKINLPKAHSGLVTFKMMVANKLKPTDETTITNPGTVVIRTSSSDTSDAYSYPTGSGLNAWQTTKTAQKGASDHILIRTYNGAGAHTLVVYIAFIMDGDQLATLNG